MPTGPQGQKRPAGVTACAVHVMKIATGEIEESPPKDARRAAGGRAGGEARAKALSPARRREIALQGAAARGGR